MPLEVTGCRDRPPHFNNQQFGNFQYAGGRACSYAHAPALRVFTAPLNLSSATDCNAGRQVELNSAGRDSLTNVLYRHLQ